MLSAKPVTTKVRAGDTIYSILKREGFNENQRRMVIADQVIPVEFTIAPGDRYIVSKPSASEKEITFFPSDSNVGYVLWKKGDNAGARTDKIRFDKKVETKEGRVRGSLVESISKVVGDDLIAYRFMDAYLLDYNLPRMLRRNAMFNISFEKLFYEGTFVRYGEVLNAGLEIGEEFVERTFKRFSDGGVYIEGAYRHDSRPLYAPVNYIRISSLFQARRYHPIKKFRRAHLGVDFELPKGSPVLAATAGTVLRFGKNRAAGNFVVLGHAGGIETYYNHLDEISPEVRKGRRLGAGTKLGTIGCTGYCTKPHLHYAVKKKGKFVDPIPLTRGYSFVQREQVSRQLAKIYED